MKKWRQKKIFFLMSRKARVQFSRARRSCRFQRKFSAVSAFSFFSVFFVVLFYFNVRSEPDQFSELFFLGGGKCFPVKKKSIYLVAATERIRNAGRPFFFCSILFYFLFLPFWFPGACSTLSFSTAKRGESESVWRAFSLLYLVLFYLFFFEEKKRTKKKQFSSPPDTDPHRSFPPLLSFSFFSFSFFLLFFRGSG